MATLAPDAPTRLPLPPVLAPPTGGVAFDDYLAFERTSLIKHHFHDGSLVDVAGASLEHNTINANFQRGLGNTLENTDCRVLGSDMKVFVSRKAVYYPDTVVFCGDPVMTFEEALQTPVLLAEVLSPSTALFDRGEKFRRYRTIASLRHILFLEQASPMIEHYEREDSGVWVLRGDHHSLEQNLTLAIGGEMVSLPLWKIYRHVTFPEASNEVDEEAAAETVDV